MTTSMIAQDMHPMSWKILYSLPNAMPLNQVASGDLTQQAETIRVLQSRGHRITFIAPRDTFQVICTDQWDQPTLARRTWTDTFTFNIAARASWRLQRLLGVPYLNYFSNWRLYDAAIQYIAGHDLVHERCGLYRTGVARASRKLGIPYVLFFDADELLEADFENRPITGVLRWRARQMMRYCLKSADRIITVCEPAQRHLVDHWHVPSEKIFVLPNAVDVQRHRPYPEKRAAIRAAWGLKDEPLLIFVSSFYKWHDISTALQAFARVLVLHPDARLLLVGDGKTRSAMQIMANELQIAQRVIFTGKVSHEQIPALISASDVALALYPKMEQEFWGSPMKVFEYMAAGTAIVATAAGQLRDVLSHECSALLVLPGEVEDVVTAILTLIAKPELRIRLGRQARQQAVFGHSWEYYVQQLEVIYAAAIKANANKRP